jgi:hypothetical protein
MSYRLHSIITIPHLTQPSKLHNDSKLLRELRAIMPVPSPVIITVTSTIWPTPTSLPSPTPTPQRFRCRFCSYTRGGIFMVSMMVLFGGLALIIVIAECSLHGEDIRALIVRFRRSLTFRRRADTSTHAEEVEAPIELQVLDIQSPARTHQRGTVGVPVFLKSVIVCIYSFLQSMAMQPIVSRTLCYQSQAYSA